MRIIGLSAWRTLLVQSLTVFSLFVGLGLSLLATGILWRRARRRRHARYHLKRVTVLSRRTP